MYRMVIVRVRIERVLYVGEVWSVTLRNGTLKKKKSPSTHLLGSFLQVDTVEVNVKIPYTKMTEMIISTKVFTTKKKYAVVGSISAILFYLQQRGSFIFSFSQQHGHSADYLIV